MNLPERLENAVTKLYKAFHKGELQAEDCSMCAVGNICNNSSAWMAKIDSIVSVKDGDYTPSFKVDSDYLCFSTQSEIQDVLDSGYDFYELAEIEKRFVEPMILVKKENKETQFKGLCSVVKYLCELDGVENIMEIQSLFEYENNKPLKQLNEVI